MTVGTFFKNTRRCLFVKDQNALDWFGTFCFCFILCLQYFANACDIQEDIIHASFFNFEVINHIFVLGYEINRIIFSIDCDSIVFAVMVIDICLTSGFDKVLILVCILMIEDDIVSRIRVLQLCRCSLCNDLAFVHNDDKGRFLSLLHIMSGEEDSHLGFFS